MFCAVRFVASKNVGSSTTQKGLNNKEKGLNSTTSTVRYFFIYEFISTTIPNIINFKTCYS